jgi:hypothetical protein
LSLVIDETSANLVGTTVTVHKLDETTVTFTAISGAPSATEFDVGATQEDAAGSLAAQMQANSDLAFTLNATNPGTREVNLSAVVTGARGNAIAISWLPSATASNSAIRLLTPSPDIGPFNEVITAAITFANFSGGEDLVNNAGPGNSQLQLTGMTERLPLGILLQDSDFMGENPLNDNASAMKTSPAGLRPVQTILPLTTGGKEFDRFLGDPGQLIALSDGAILRYTAFHSADAPTGTKKFRLYRGGGAVFVLSGENPGGPIDWVSESFPASFLPVLKGGALACKALLVRNYHEEAFATVDTTTEGDEIQMVILTHGILGDGQLQRDGLQMIGVISPTGYGEGYAAADRYRCEGKPMFSGLSRTTPDPTTVNLAVFPGREE